MRCERLNCAANRGFAGFWEGCPSMQHGFTCAAWRPDSGHPGLITDSADDFATALMAVRFAGLRGALRTF